VKSDILDFKYSCAPPKQDLDIDTEFDLILVTLWFRQGWTIGRSL